MHGATTGITIRILRLIFVDLFGVKNSILPWVEISVVR